MSIKATPGTHHVPLRVHVRDGCPHVVHAETGEPVVLGGKFAASGWVLGQGANGLFVLCRLDGVEIEEERAPAPFTGTPPEAIIDFLD